MFCFYKSNVFCLCKIVYMHVICFFFVYLYLPLFFFKNKHITKKNTIIESKTFKTQVLTEQTSLNLSLKKTLRSNLGCD